MLSTRRLNVAPSKTGTLTLCVVGHCNRWDMTTHCGYQFIKLCQQRSEAHREGPKLGNHNFKKHLGVSMATDGNFVYPLFNCSTTTISFYVSVVFDSHCRRHRWERGRLPSSSTCGGCLGLTVLRASCQHYNTVYWAHNRYHSSETLRVSACQRPFLK